MFEKPTLQKRCIVKTCEAYPCFGYGLPSWKIPMVFACAQHRDKLGTGDGKGISFPRQAVSVAGGGVKPSRQPPASPRLDLFSGV
jgi:hypothetical protein